MLWEEPSPISIRINTAKWEKRPQTLILFHGAGTDIIFKTDPHSLSIRYFHSGCYYPQEASSMFLEQVIRQTKVLSGNLRYSICVPLPEGKVHIF